MDRRRLEDRLAALEALVTPTKALGPAEIAETAARLRAEGKSEGEVYRALEAKDPSLMRRGLVGLRQYLACDRGWAKPEHWAAAHKDPLVAIVGRLRHLKAFSVATPGGERETVDLPEGFDWKGLDPLELFFLSLLVHHAPAWTTYWSRSREFRARVSPAAFYILSAARRARRFEAETPKARVKELRAEVGRRIDWIAAQETKPAALPWAANTETENAA